MNFKLHMVVDEDNEPVMQVSGGDNNADMVPVVSPSKWDLQDFIDAQGMGDCWKVVQATLTW